MAAYEVFANQAQTTVTSGGTTAPSAGTSQSWTVASSSLFPAVTSGVTQFHVCDPVAASEIIAVTAVSGSTWTVTRGAEGTTPVTHASGFTVFQDLTAGGLTSFAQVLHPSGDTSGVKDAALINAAISAVPASGGTVVLAATAPWYIECGQVVVTQSGVFINATGCYIYAVGAGDMIRMYSTDYGTDVTEGGGITGSPFVDGSNTTGNACAFHAGDILQLDAYLSVAAFTAGTTSKGVWLDNNYRWTEQMCGRIRANDCTAGVVFDNSANTSGQATGSFDRADVDIYIDNANTGDGVVLQNGAIIIDGALNIWGNFGQGASQHWVLNITGSNTGGDSGISGCFVNIGVENASNSGTTPGTIRFGSSGNFMSNCAGTIDFSAYTAFASSNNNQNFLFYGPVYGDAALLTKIASPPVGYTASSGFPTGWSGYIGFTAPQGDGMIFAAVVLSVASGTVISYGEILISSGLPAWAIPTDTKAIPVDMNGTYGSVIVTSGGSVIYNGPTQTSSSTIYPYGQTWYYNS